MAFHKTLTCLRTIHPTSDIFLVAKSFSTSSIACKKTPHTVGVMSWVKANKRRKHLEKKMKEKPREDHQIVKEHILERMEPEIEFLTSSRVKTRMNDEVMNRNSTEPTVFLSKDRQTIICYHPPPPSLPEQFTKRATASKKLGLTSAVFEHFQDSLTDDQIQEAKNLREQDPVLWSANALAVLMQATPQTINEHIPLTRDQSSIVRAEKELYGTMSVNNRKKFKDLQVWERMKYVNERRDEKFAHWYQNFNKKSSVKAPVPPKR